VYFLGAFAIFAAANETTSQQSSALKLTPAERSWFKEHPTIRLSPDPDFLPVEFINESGEYRGIAADYIKLIEKITGLEFKVLTFKNWVEVLEKNRNKK
jgi:hypothetical protein